VVRHPRYLSAGLAVIAVALFVNYVGVYTLILLLFPLGHPMLVLEERELADRFGEEYRQYQRQVPRIIPRWRREK
jgi:protein-S-isoprenylcysteine O-methyltransferase Ste14